MLLAGVARAVTNIEQLPKVELHCHLDGVPDPAMLQELQRRGYRLPVTAAALAAAYPVQGVDDFFRWFTVAQPFEGDLARYGPVLAIHLERLKAQHVVYTEITIGGSELPLEPAAAVEQLAAFRAWVTAQEAGQVQVEFLLVLNRARPPDVIAQAADRVLALHAAGLIAGVMLAGREQGYPVRRLHHTLARLHEAGVPIEIHAGEWCGPESVWDALQYGYPDRIGHGVTLFQDPRLVALVGERRLHLEMCPTSNWKTGAVARLADHPVRLARDLGLSFSINTDDPGPFECSMASEYQLVADTFGFRAADFAQIAANALAARFCQRLRYQ
jgi:adenosine deaminase